jgi:hypothetical protein
MPNAISSRRYRRPHGAVHPAKNEGVDFQDDAVEEILRVT